MQVTLPPEKDMWSGKTTPQLSVILKGSQASDGSLVQSFRDMAEGLVGNVESLEQTMGEIAINRFLNSDYNVLRDRFRSAELIVLNRFLAAAGDERICRLTQM